MKKLLLAAALALAPTAVLADQPAAPTDRSATAPAAAPIEDADPALWVLRDEDTTIYLFGTIHMLDGRPWFNDEVKAAFDASEELVLEAQLPENPAELQPLVIRYAVAPDGPPLSERLSPEQYAVLDRIVTSTGAPAGAFDRLEPWFVSITLPALVAQRHLGMSPENSPEMVLSAAARERGIDIGELEGIEWQFRLFDNMPLEQQMTMLSRSLESFDEMDEQLAPMLSAWSSGNVEGLAEMMNRALRDTPDLYRLLFTQRNAAWVDWIRQRMARPGTVFLAVGAGHLAGDDSVRALLEAHGIRSERVPQAEGGAAASQGS